MKEEAELARKEKRNSMNRVKEKGRKKMERSMNRKNKKKLAGK